MAKKKRKAKIVYGNYAGREFEKQITGTEAEIEAEVERMLTLPDVNYARAEYQD